MIRCGIMWISGEAHGELLPTFTSVTANVAPVLATHRSQACAISQPPANAAPLTAAIVGFDSSTVSYGHRNIVARRHRHPRLDHLLEIAARAERLVPCRR